MAEPKFLQEVGSFLTSWRRERVGGRPGSGPQTVAPDWVNTSGGFKVFSLVNARTRLIKLEFKIVSRVVVSLVLRLEYSAPNLKKC